MMTTRNRKKSALWGLRLLVAGVLLLANQSGYALTDKDCMDCHEDAIKMDEFKESVHAENGCLSCHKEATDAKGEHEHPLPAVNCGRCHGEVLKVYEKSLHGEALAGGDSLAPHCYDCHTKHNIRSSSDKKSSTFIMKIPYTCGQCHQEGAPVARNRDIHSKNILENYSESIHGEGLYRKGLVVTAVCSSCHTAHNVLPHTDPNSSISRLNVVKTCMKCHTNIEQAHVKIVRGALWEEEPHKVPACVECHSPHKARRVLYEDSMNDNYCMNCHGNTDLKIIQANGEEKSLYVDPNKFENSIHKEKRIACVKCHVNINHNNTPVCKDSGAVDCSICHAQQVKDYQESIHGQLVTKNDANAPHCKDCHGEHNILPRKNSDSPIFARNIPDLCAKCHREGEAAALRYRGTQQDVIKHYKESIHGKGLGESGLMVSASCTNCHTAHKILPSKDPNSTVNPDKVIDTCAACHLGIAEKFKNSIHSPLVSKTDKKLPRCNDCHTSHTIKRVDMANFRALILDECGTCHKHESETYFDTYHGKASLLSGGEKTAKCSDCHGSHDILPPFYSKSKLHRNNVVETCRKCHPNSNRKFTGYLTHATHHDREKYPYLFYTFWAMSGLLMGTFAFFGIHTLFWIPRSFRERFKRRREHSHEKVFKK